MKYRATRMKSIFGSAMPLVDHALYSAVLVPVTTFA